MQSTNRLGSTIFDLPFQLKGFQIGNPVASALKVL